MADILHGIVVGGAGGAIAGITVSLIHWGASLHQLQRDKKIVHKWLTENTRDQAGEQFRSTRAIASWTNLTEDRVRYVCSTDERVYLSTGEKEDMWGVYARSPR